MNSLLEKCFLIQNYVFASINFWGLSVDLIVYCPLIVTYFRRYKM